MSNAAQAVWDHASADPERIALRGAGEPWSYGRLRERAAAFAAQLAAEGVGPGARVLLVCPSVPEFAAAYYGIHAAGAVAVTANTMSTRPELEYLGGDAGCTLVVDWHEVGPAAAEAAEALGITRWALSDELADVPASPTPDAEPYATADDDDAVILYTSGTTGRPKGAELTHGNLIACASVFNEVLEFSPEDRFGTALPLFHVFGQAVVMGTTLRAGATLSLLARFDAEGLLDLLGRDGLTVMAGVPTMWNALLHAAGDRTPADFATLRLAASGGASLPAEVMRAFEERFGCVILEGYGLSETTGAATFNGLGRERKPACVGIALPGSDVEIRGDDGQERPAGEVGEVFIRGPVVMKGYWNRPEATAEVLQDGWLRTGDLGTKDGDGDIRIVDRKKDLIIRGGYNVYPREVEEVLYEHPDIVEVAVIGLPDDHFGEEVAAVLSLREGATFDAAELRTWAKERLSAYKVPRVFQVVDALPKGPTGKILKRAIDTDAVRGAQPASGAAS
ncbi:MAG TPA: long-chain fatty acid--CoA ligase [Baekduia sp.]|nr:long-chain fatty acid--CoA ligase [Baekduia sp.]